MALKVDILRTTEDGQEILGSLRLDDGKIVADAGAELLLERKELLGSDGNVVSIDDPIAWMKALVGNVNGSYLRATEAYDA